MEQPEYWANPADSKYWEDVNEGDQLPELDYPVTTKVLIAGVVGTRDFMPYHHNSQYVKEFTAGRDMFLNTMHHMALMGRFATDWSGPDSDIRRMTLQMLIPVCPGDSVKVEGKVTRKYREGDDYRAEVEVLENTQLGVSARSTVTFAMTSREGGPAKPRLRFEQPRVDPNPDMPDFARAWLGNVSPPSWCAYPISDSQIMYWCDMVEDGNPLYVDGEYARKGRYGGVIAPWHSLLTWTMGRPGHTGVNSEAPDAGEPHRKPWPPREQQRAMAFSPPGTTETIATNSVQEYGPPLRPGDRIYTTGQVVTCTPLKETRFGKGYFQTILTSVYNQRDEIVGTNLFTLLRYGIKD